MRIRKVISVILAVVIITACYSVFEFTASAITTASQLKSALESGNGFTLTADIDMSGQAVISSVTGNNIQITGNGHCIKNLSVTSGLYSTLSGSCSISGLSLYNCTVVKTSAANQSSAGLIAGALTFGASVSISNCIADGAISVSGSSSDDSYNCYIGGLIGYSPDGATLNISGSTAMCDIFENISIDRPNYANRVAYIGGMVGYHGTGYVKESYSTGTIDNAHTYHYIGGMVGYSKAATYQNSYTSLFIEHPYTDNVRSIGSFYNAATYLSSNVYYDKTVSIQRQDINVSGSDCDAHGKTPAEIATLLTGAEWHAEPGFYPMVDAVWTNPNSKPLSSISAARVDLNLTGGATGRDYFILSSTSAYTYATLSNNSGVAVWKITGGLDEYYFDPSNEGAPTNGARTDGLSGNAYDTDNGKYLFVTLGDISFTATNGDYSRTITVHVLNSNPYIGSGSGISGAPYLISNQHELDYVRLYNQTGENYFRVSQDIALSGNFQPISDFKCTFNGNSKTISGLNIITSSASTHSSGLFANLKANASIDELNLSNANIEDDEGCVNAGVLAGESSGATIEEVITSGTVDGAPNGGMLIGQIDAATTLTSCATMGFVTSAAVSGNIGGLIGTCSGGTNTITNCYSTASVAGDTANVSGLIGYVSTGSTSLTGCLFTGMLYNGAQSGAKNPLVGGTATLANTFYDKQSVGEFTTTAANAPYAKTTAQLCSLVLNGWSSNSSRYPVISALNSNGGNFATACNLMSEKIDYGTNGHSRVFTTAGISSSYTYEYKNNLLDTGETETRYSYENGLFTFIKSGIGFYTMKPASSVAGTRYLLFNVKGLMIYYKFTYPTNDSGATKAAFLRDMSSHGLITLRNQANDDFNLILNSANETYSQVTYEFVTAPTDALTYIGISCNSSFYTCTMTAGLDSATQNTLVNNTIEFKDATAIYVNFNITPVNPMPWGIYFSNTTV